MLLLKSSSRLWDEILSHQPTHISVITYGIQRTLAAHSSYMRKLLTDKRTRIILCPNNSSIPNGIKYRETTDCHTKLIILHREDQDVKYFLTSMNLEVGLWENFLFEVTSVAIQKQMATHFQTKWDSADDPTPLPTFDHLIK